MSTLITNDHIYGPPDFIVDTRLGRGTHQNIASAFTSAEAEFMDTGRSSAIAIASGTYVGNLDVPGNVEVYGVPGAGGESVVTIQGLLTFTKEGSQTFSDITFRQNGSFNIEITGTNSGTAIFKECSIFYSVDTMVEWSGTNKNVQFRNCSTLQQGEGLKYVNMTGAGQFRILRSQHFNTFFSNFVASTVSANNDVLCTYSNFQSMAFHFTGDSRAEFFYNSCTSGSIGLPFFLLEGANSVEDRIRHNHFVSGSTKVITINGSRNSDCSGNTVDTSAVAAIDGTGTINYGAFEFLQTMNTVTTSTQNAGTLVTGEISFDGGVNVFTGGSGISGFTYLNVNKGFEYYSHCTEDPLLKYQVNLATASIINTDPRSGTPSEHPGQWRFRLDDSPSARAVLQEASAAATRPHLLGGGTWVFETLVNFETLSTAADEYISVFGLVDARSADPITDGVYFEYDRTNSVNFFGVTESGSTRTELDSSVAVSISSATWVTLRFEINAAGNSVEFFVNGASIGTSITNIPSTDLQTFVRSQKSSSTGSQNVMYLDYIYLRNQLTTII